MIARLRSICAGALIAMPLLLVQGCGQLLSFNLQFVGEQTSLERQVLGTYSALSRDLEMYSSVRGVSEDGSLRTPPPATESQRDAYLAMRNQEYNRDDIERILRAGIVGEGNDGMLESRPGALPAVEGLTTQEVLLLIEEENRDRQVLIARLQETTPDLRPTQAGEVVWIYARMKQDLSPIGTWIQNRDGSWVRK